MIEATNKREYFKKMYECLLDEVADLSHSAQNALPAVTEGFLVGRFEELLQYILLAAAAWDGEYSEEENEIIAGAVTRSSLVDVYNEIEIENGGKLVLGWETLPAVMNINGAQGILALLSSFAQLVDPRTEFIVKALAPVSCMHYRNYFYEIMKRLRYTLVAFTDVCGIEDKEGALSVVQPIIDQYLVDPWTYECETFCKEFLKDEEPLKRLYEGKAKLDEIDLLDKGENDDEI